MTASTTSKTAVATSEASARVGVGALIIDSSIWVATITGLPATRQAWMTCRCTVGTSSGGISTPRSPRATISASESSMISSSRRIAAGFSSLTMIQAALPISLRASATSSGRCTKESAIQSAPCSSAKERSARSFSVIAEIGSTTFGTLTPLWSDSMPPTRISVSAQSPPHLVTRRRSLPSSSKSSVPGSIAANTSGWRKGARTALPGLGSRSKRKRWPVTSSARPLTKLPTRSLGPCISARMPIGRPVSASTWRISAKLARCRSCVPWLKLRRNTSTPASNRARMRSPPALAGPKVATIFALRRRRMTRFRPRARSAGGWLGEDEHGSEIVDIGQGRTGYDKVAQGGEESITVILRQLLIDGDALRGGTLKRVRINNRPGIVFCSIEAVSVAGERGDLRRTAQGFGERQQEFAVAPAAAAAMHRDRGLAAGQQHRRRRHDLGADAKLPGGDLQRDRGMHQGDVAGLALDPVAQHDGGDAAGERGIRGGGERLLRAGDHLEAAPAEDRVAGLRRLRFRGGQMGDDRRGLGDAVFGEDGLRIGKGRRVGECRAGGDHRGMIPRYVGNRQGEDARRRRGRGEAAALDRREVLPHRVDLADRRAGAQQAPRHRLLVGERQPRSRQCQKGRAAARYQAHQLILRAEPASQVKDAPRRFLPSRVGNRVSRLDNLDVPARNGMAVAGDDDAIDGAGPGFFEGAGHRGRRLAGADHNSAAGDRLRQVPGDRAGWVGSGESRVKQRAQALSNPARFARVHTRIPSGQLALFDWPLPFAPPFHIDRAGKASATQNRRHRAQPLTRARSILGRGEGDCRDSGGSRVRGLLW